MAEKSNKYGAIAQLRQPRPKEREHEALAEESSPVNASLLTKAPRPQGKRSDPAWKQYSVLLKKETHKRAGLILRQKYDGTDISDLMQALLEQWVNSEMSS